MSKAHCPKCGKEISSNTPHRICKKCGRPHCYGHGAGSKCGDATCGGFLG